MLTQRLVVVCFALLISGCAGLPVPFDIKEAAEAPASQPAADSSGSFRLSGRIGVLHDGNSFSGSLRWSHDSENDEIFILSPLGQGVARIVRSPQGVMLETGEGRTYHAEDVESLTQEVLGWRLPARGLQYWVTGRAAPDMPGEGRISSDKLLINLDQDGWHIDYSRYRTVQGTPLPAKMEMLARDSQLEVRLVIDQWVLP